MWGGQAGHSDTGVTVLTASSVLIISVQLCLNRVGKKIRKYYRKNLESENSHTNLTPNKCIQHAKKGQNMQNAQTHAKKYVAKLLKYSQDLSPTFSICV